MTRRALRELRVITWNVCVENHPDNIRRGLAELAKRRPHVIALQECYRFRAHLDGYTTFQLPPATRHDGLVDESASVAVLVRDDVKVRRHQVVRMTRTWVGPKAGRRHAPRVFHAFVIVVDGKQWKVSGGHWALPAGTAAAVAEHEHWLRGWQRSLLRPTAHLADFNQQAHVLAAKGFEAIGHGVDLAAVGKHVHHIGARKLPDEYGSDHFPVEITLAA